MSPPPLLTLLSHIRIRSSTSLVLLALVGVHGQRVEKSSGDGNGRSNDGSGRHGRLEGNDGRDNDDNTLDGVSDSVRDGVDLAESQEGDLVVGVVGGTSESEEGGQGLGGPLSALDDLAEGTEHAGSLNSKHEGDEDGGRHGSEDGVQVLGIKVLADLLAGHGLLGEDTTGRRGQVGEHGGTKSQKGEGELLHGGNGDSTNDGQKGHVHIRGKELTEKEGVQGARNDRLGGLDDVSERDGSGSESNHGSDVDSRVAKSDGEERLEVSNTQLGGLAETGEPKRSKVEDSSGHLDGGDRPGVGQDVQGPLVVDVVTNVEEVPEGKVSTNLEGLQQAGSLLRRRGLGDGTSSGRKSQGGAGAHLPIVRSSSMNEEEVGG